MVSTDSSFHNRTVFEAFQDMSLGSEPVELDHVKSWMSEWMPNGLFTNLQKIYPWFFDETFDKTYASPNLNDAEAVLDVFIKHKDNLIKMLVLLDYTWDVAEKTVSCIIEDFQNSLIEFRVLSTPNYAENLLEVTVYDVSLFGRHLSSALCNGMHCSIALFPNDVLIPFYCFFVQKCYESSIPNIISLELTKNKMKPIQIPCPMIIFEDADIASAVSSFCKSVCKFKTTSSDVVSHLFIQESVFDNTISLLESTLKKMRHGSRFDKKTELEYIMPSEEIETLSHNLKVFTPYKNSPIKLFVGWSPTDTDQSDLLKNSRGHIPSVPFRNSDDLGILLKELKRENRWLHNSLSVWGEKISNIRTFPYELQLFTLWINSHGLTHPLTPYVIHNYFISTVKYFYKESLEKSGTLIDTLSIISKSHYKINLVEALDDALKTFNTWHFNKAEIKLKILEPIYKLFTSSRKETPSRAITPKSTSANEMIKHFIDTSLTECLASKAKVITEYRPVGVVLVIVLHFYIKLEMDLPRLVSSLLIQGNAVVVAASKNNLKYSSNILKKVYDNTYSYSLLTFLECTENNMHELLITPVRRIIVGHYKSSPFTRDNYYEYLVALNNNYLHDDDYCLQLSTISKSTWFL